MTRESLNTAVLDALRMNRSVVFVWRAAGWWVTRSDSPVLIPVPST